MTALGAGFAAAAFAVLVGLVAGEPLPGALVGGGILLGVVLRLIAAPAVRANSRRGGAAIDDAAAGWDEFHRELARARRHGGTFTIVRFATAAGGGDAATLRLRDEIAAAARRTDRTWRDEGNILLLLPETAPSAAAVLLDRLSAAAPLASSSEPTVVHFPDHGTTSGALIAAVYGAGGAEVPTPISAARSTLRPHAAGPRDDDSDRGGDVAAGE